MCLSLDLAVLYHKIVVTYKIGVVSFQDRVVPCTVNVVPVSVYQDLVPRVRNALGSLSEYSIVGYARFVAESGHCRGISFALTEAGHKDAVCGIDMLRSIAESAVCSDFVMKVHDLVKIGSVFGKLSYYCGSRDVKLRAFYFRVLFFIKVVERQHGYFVFRSVKKIAEPEKAALLGIYKPVYFCRRIP